MSETDLEQYAKQRIGMVLRGKYRLDSVLGVGGMAAVYKATHRNQAEFAVKMLHPGLSVRQDVHTRFLREGYAANSVKHPGAVLVVDDDTAEDGAAFLVMELLDGEGIEALWERHGSRLPASIAASIVIQLLDVLAAAHAKGIVHRDIKPANLFLVHGGTLKVLDFGIARARDAISTSAGHTGTGILLGTPAFMPPEQAMAKSTEIDAQTDVWAAGATLFTLVSGHLVHEGDNAAQLMIRAATAPARPMASLAPGVPPAIAQVVDRALAFEKAGRWPSAAAMRDALIEACRMTYGETPSKASLALQLLPPANAALAATALAPAAVAVARTMDSRPGSTPSFGSSPGYGSGASSGSGSNPGATSPWSRATPVAAISAPQVAPTQLAPAPPIVGGTTAQPIATTPSASREDAPAGLPKRAGLPLMIGAALVLLAAGSFGALALTRSGEKPPPAAAGLVVPAAPEALTAAATAPPSAPPLAATPADAGLVVSVSPPKHQWNVPANVPPSQAPTRTPAHGASPGAAGVPTPPKAKPNCDPNFTLDAEGNKHFKPECF